ncbi:HD domain-containing protein [Sphingomonas mucosissima]|uniref:Guanosine-3',5'-bis(Diphosphate) 3'-pyrophosphohydrolase n=1 Tax=Sphingomonas mucosissima TaxID=370959 RepID=A0A245ZJ90_9SPHN|nr:HD domain-containing protein [Sphingomonas mucosissima]OWK29807.1 guanosine-3',5'-bis(diphosphate) 3'-pyrophosphohydrolase [Sphingomonas mucosissima]
MNTTDPARSLLDAAIVLATDAHRGQVDKAGAPYILHPLRVMLAQADDARRIAAVLHDVVEDCAVAPDTIRARFGDAVADAVVALTRRHDEDYDAFVTRCAADPIARDVSAPTSPITWTCRAFPPSPTGIATVSPSTVGRSPVSTRARDPCRHRFDVADESGVLTA